MTKADATTAPAQPGLAERLRGVVVETRGELDISRHVFRDGPAYVVRDPITFATHRLDPEDYAVFSAIGGERTLGDIFERLVGSGEMDRGEEEAFYAFVLDMHQRSLLALPINNAEALYQRFEKRRRAERLSKLLGVFFLRVPLVNPDRFLSRTLPFFRWMFTLPALIAWALLCTAAGVVVVARFGELTAPAMTILDGDNLMLLWVALVGLKVIHEFGHAYACKAFGGHVPEMGAFLILFTPVAYVDATDSWTFTRTRQRAIVTLAGVYFESIVGALAVFVWAVTEPSTLNAFAYQVIILATVTTAAFNLNPLLRYDAYYLVSDLVAIPNLRARCQESLAAAAKRAFFGVRVDAEGEPLVAKPGLALFGAAQLAYRVVVMLTITSVLVLKFHTAGMMLAGVFVGMTVVKACVTLVRYVLASEEVSGARARAVLTSFGGIALLASAAVLVPVPWPVEVKGVVSYEGVASIRAPRAGTVDSLNARGGDRHHEGDLLAVISDPDLHAEREVLLADLEASADRATLASLESPGAGVETAAEAEALRARLEHVEREIVSLRVTAPSTGRVLELAAPHPGVWLDRGDPILFYASGEPEAVFHVRSFEFDALRLEVGDPFECRSLAHPSRSVTGTVTHIAGVGAREIGARVRQAVPGGLVPISAQDGLATEPYFEIRVRLHPADADLAGARLVAKLPTEARTTASVIRRRVARFLNRVKEGAGS